MRKLFVVVAIAAAATARAGIANSPIPPLQGQPAAHVFSVSGVVTSGGLGTFFSCTSTAKSNILVSVEVFDDDGTGSCNDASAVSQVVPPGGTVMFATQNSSTAFSSAHLLTPSPIHIGAGSARILATSKSVVCSAFVADAYNAPPTTMARLNIVAKTKQKGE